MASANEISHGERLALIGERQEAVIGAVHGLADTIAILSEQIGELVDACAPIEPEPGEETLPQVLARIADQIGAQTAAIGELTRALDARGD
jgi:hypothetical protein